ncbi:glycosyltransferase family 2 protein [Hymenobacter sp. BT186]|uniref:Glycosyltransferase family 2 protein n=1 Tax=Hymenobacter telluris TaxID=2816474 RepID=A0A939JCK1_9BACT|nr:glycosyltransferase [Hymenobacter telluris]MBO0357372.1 glycosyltransferase family 2 protein [Hymenobacter telluris]MBW3373398.1 glycosyltransferase family 2 protein [Hymenobacter norwichensis]
MSFLNGVSFLICTYNSASRITETLRHLAEQELSAGIKCEIILVDNACTDDTALIAENYWKQSDRAMPLRIFREQRPGKNFAVELAFQKAQYCYACIVDDDNRLNNDYLRIGYHLLESNAKIGIIGGPNAASFDIVPPSWFPAYQHCYAVGEQKGYNNGRFEVFADGNIGRNALWGAGMFVRTIIWHQLYSLGFKSLFIGRQGSKNLTAGEDDELCYVAQMLGYEIWYSSKLYLIHHMTAVRLTKSYRNRLFYSSVWSQTRIFAYINTLWGNPIKYLSISNHLKDTAYMIKGVLKRMITLQYVKDLIKWNEVSIMNVNRDMLIIYARIKDMKNVKNYYLDVMDLKKRIDKNAHNIIQSNIADRM